MFKAFQVSMFIMALMEWCGYEFNGINKMVWSCISYINRIVWLCTLCERTHCVCLHYFFSLSHPVIPSWVMEGVKMDASVVSLPPLSVLRTSYRCGNAIFCPFFNVLSFQDYLPFSSLFTPNFSHIR